MSPAIVAQDTQVRQCWTLYPLWPPLNYTLLRDRGHKSMHLLNWAWKTPMRDIDCFVAFTAWKTRQHLSATAFLPFSNIDFLRLLLSVCLHWYKNQTTSKNFCCLFLKNLHSVVIKCQNKFTQSKVWGICRLWAFLLYPWGIQQSLHAWSLACYSPVLLDWDELGGFYTGGMYALGQEV